MKPDFVVCDPETEYAVHFMEYLNRRRIPFEVQVFTSAEGLCEYGKDRHIELLLVSEKVMCEDVRALDVGQLILLSEEAGEPFGEMPSVYKYQSGAKIVREVMDCYSAEQQAGKAVPEPHLRQGQLNGVCGISDPVAQMLFTLTYGQILASEQSVLYVNLQKYVLPECLSAGEAGGDLGDLMYLYRNGQRGFAARLAGMIRRIGRLDYLPAPFSPEDLGEFSGEEWQGFLHRLNTSGGHDVVLLDLSDALRGLPGILRMCGRRTGLSGDDTFSLHRRKKLEETWQLGDDGITWLTLPDLPAFRDERWFLESLPETGLGAFIRRNMMPDR